MIHELIAELPGDLELDKRPAPDPVGPAAADGGDVELVDLKEADGVWEVYIEYKGACMGCPSAGTNTLSAIEALLKQKLGENIKVVPS